MRQKEMERQGLLEGKSALSQAKMEPSLQFGAAGLQLCMTTILRRITAVFRPNDSILWLEMVARSKGDWSLESSCGSRSQ